MRKVSFSLVTFIPSYIEQEHHGSDSEQQNDASSKVPKEVFLETFETSLEEKGHLKFVRGVQLFKRPDTPYHLGMPNQNLSKL
jgi:hypothetical protein